MWTERPLTPLLRQYAADDARLLLKLWRRMAVQDAGLLPSGHEHVSCSGAAASCSLVRSLSQLQASPSGTNAASRKHVVGGLLHTVDSGPLGLCRRQRHVMMQGCPQVSKI